MEKEKVIVIFKILKNNYQADLELPLNITANDLVRALNEAYSLGIDTEDLKKCYLKSENPIALLRGNKTLAEFGIHDGSLILAAD